MKNYTVTFFDKSFVAVTATQAKAVMETMNAGIKNIQINGNMYAVSSISKVEKNKDEIAGGYNSQQLTAPENLVKKETIERMKKELSNKFGYKFN